MKRGKKKEEGERRRKIGIGNGGEEGGKEKKTRERGAKDEGHEKDEEKTKETIRE